MSMISRIAAEQEMDEKAAPDNVLSMLDFCFDAYQTELANKHAGLPFSQSIMNRAEEWILGVAVAEQMHQATG